MRILIASLCCLTSFLCIAQNTQKPPHDSTLVQSELALTSDSSQCSVLYCAEGIASFYGRQFHGRKTSSGEKFDMFDFTAAHKTLPFGTIVIVTDLYSKKSVTVRVNDRMPLWNKREIDLSQRAANDLGFILKGITKVQLEILKTK